MDGISMYGDYVWARNTAIMYGYREYRYHSDEDIEDRWKPLSKFDPHNGYFCPKYYIYISNNESFIQDTICGYSNEISLRWYLR